MIRPQTCAVCGKDLVVDGGEKSNLFPFCSKRCREIDLYRWCTGRYAIAQEISPEEAELLSSDEYRPEE